MKVVVFLMPLLMLPGATEIHGHQADDPLPVLLEKAIRDQDLDEAVQLFHRLEGEDNKSFDPDAELLSRLGNLLLEKARYEESRKVFDFNHARHPRQAGPEVHSLTVQSQPSKSAIRTTGSLPSHRIRNPSLQSMRQYC